MRGAAAVEVERGRRQEAGQQPKATATAETANDLAVRLPVAPNRIEPRIGVEGFCPIAVAGRLGHTLFTLSCPWPSKHCRVHCKQDHRRPRGPCELDDPTWRAAVFSMTAKTCAKIAINLEAPKPRRSQCARVRAETSQKRFRRDSEEPDQTPFLLSGQRFGHVGRRQARSVAHNGGHGSNCSNQGAIRIVPCTLLRVDAAVCAPALVCNLTQALN